MKKNNRVTRQDVADRAGVSTATVSYVINNGPRPVADETRRRILQVIDELGYYPNELARSLTMKQTLTFGFVVPDLVNPYFANIAQQFEDICFAKGYMVFICDTHRDLAKEIRIAESLRSKQVDGVAIVPDSGSLRAIQILEQAGIATVVMEHDTPNLQCVAIDDFNGGMIGTEHLLALGHRRIAHIRQEGSTTSQRRHQGYVYAHQSAGLAPAPAYTIACGYEFSAGIQAMNYLLGLPERPTAVFAHNDVIALNAIYTIVEAGLSVPDDISVVGYDDIAEAAISRPPLTTVSYPKSAMARWTTDRLFDLIAGHDILPTTILLPTGLLVRRSTTEPR
ncbi:MAG: LacI family DNA-binding transcriptional regulator [Aggregatilineales bacterium]